jgi:hypothetical protein
MSDAEVPTPNRSQSWMLFAEIADLLASRLEKAAVAKRSGNLILRDVEGAGRALERAEFLRWIAVQFRQWPGDAEKAAVERGTLGTLLLDLQRRSEEELTAPAGRALARERPAA